MFGSEYLLFLWVSLLWVAWCSIWGCHSQLDDCLHEVEKRTVRIDRGASGCLDWRSFRIRRLEFREAVLRSASCPGRRVWCATGANCRALVELRPSRSPRWTMWISGASRYCLGNQEHGIAHSTFPSTWWPIYIYQANSQRPRAETAKNLTVVANFHRHSADSTSQSPEDPNRYFSGNESLTLSWTSASRLWNRLSRNWVCPH